MSPLVPKLGKPEIRQIVDTVLDILREDPARFRRLLREIGGLLDEVAELLRDATRPDEARLVRLGASTLRGVALLPVGAATIAIKKLADKALTKDEPKGAEPASAKKRSSGRAAPQS